MIAKSPLLSLFVSTMIAKTSVSRYMQAAGFRYRPLAFLCVFFNPSKSEAIDHLHIPRPGGLAPFFLSSEAFRVREKGYIMIALSRKEKKRLLVAMRERQRKKERAQ